jgi:hypothetical protein
MFCYDLFVSQPNAYKANTEKDVLILIVAPGCKVGKHTCKKSHHNQDGIPSQPLNPHVHMHMHTPWFSLSLSLTHTHTHTHTQKHTHSCVHIMDSPMSHYALTHHTYIHAKMHQASYMIAHMFTNIHTVTTVRTCAPKMMPYRIYRHYTYTIVLTQPGGSTGIIPFVTTLCPNPLGHVTYLCLLCSNFLQDALVKSQLI